MRAAQVLLVLLLVAGVLAQPSTDYGNTPTSAVLANGTTVTNANFGITSFLTAEDRRFAVALNWVRQDPLRFKGFMAADGYQMPEPFLARNPNLALHYDVNLAATAHFHVLEEIQKSPTNATAYSAQDMCPEPSKWPDVSCSPPAPYAKTPNNFVDVECFRREGCYNPSTDYYERMAEFDRPVAPFPKASFSGGEFIAAGNIYTGDISRQFHATESLVCDSDDVVFFPKNCTSDTFDQSFSTTKEILFTTKKFGPFGFRVQGTGYNAGTSKQTNYFDTYFASGPAPVTGNPIASGAYMRIGGTAHFVLNYREPGNDQGAPQQVGVIYQESTAATSTSVGLDHSDTAALVYSLQSTLHTDCGTAPVIEYALYAVDSKGVTWRYPENANLNVCAGTAPGDTDIIADGTATVSNNAVVFKGQTTTPPAGANPNNVPTIVFGSSSVLVLPALIMILVTLIVVLSM